MPRIERQGQPQQAGKGKQGQARDQGPARGKAAMDQDLVVFAVEALVVDPPLEVEERVKGRRAHVHAEHGAESQCRHGPGKAALRPGGRQRPEAEGGDADRLGAQLDDGGKVAQAHGPDDNRARDCASPGARAQPYPRRQPGGASQTAVARGRNSTGPRSCRAASGPRLAMGCAPNPRARCPAATRPVSWASLVSVAVRCDPALASSAGSAERLSQDFFGEFHLLLPPAVRCAMLETRLGRARHARRVAAWAWRPLGGSFQSLLAAAPAFALRGRFSRAYCSISSSSTSR